MTPAPARKEVTATAGDGRGASSRPPCPGCGRPIPPPLPDLHMAVLALLDAAAPASASTLAHALRRRKADVLAAVHGLEAAGLVAREHTSWATRWSSGGQARRGTAQEPRLGAPSALGGHPLASKGSAPPVASAAVAGDSLLAGLLVGAAYGRDWRERLAAAALLAFVVVAVLAADRPHRGRAHA